MLAGWRDSNDEHPVNIWNLIDLLRAPGTIDWDAVAMEIENGSRNNSDTTSVNTTQQRITTIAPPSPAQQPIFLAIAKKAPTYIIEKLLHHNPNAAKVKQFSTGLTPLFLAVSKGAPPEIIRLLLEAYPQAARQTAFNGCIALHLAKNVETAQLLLEAYPKGVKHCNDQGFLPLHRSAYSAWSSPEVVKLLIQVGLRQNVGGRKGRGGVLVKISHGALTPLSMICDVICNKQQQCNEERWAKFCYIAQAAVGDNMDDDDESSLFKVLHAAITLGCADTIIQLALQKHPEQVSEFDRHGHSALSCAARTKDSSSEVIQMLLNADSAMASKKSNAGGGRLPLHHMVVSGRPYGEGMEAVIHAAPQVLELRDPVTGLYPFLLAAAARKGDDLNTIYSLLRKSPWLVPPTVTASSNARVQQQNFQELLLKAHRWSSVVIVAVLAILVHVLLRQILWN